ncbi:MAG: hypothetical protein IPK72_07595 [Candidatus Eisenbacteria bacterium]|nr:hypothetical protein [Candidatus Eisenbacteria bacterium]
MKLRNGKRLPSGRPRPLLVNHALLLAWVLLALGDSVRAEAAVQQSLGGYPDQAQQGPVATRDVRAFEQRIRALASVLQGAVLQGSRREPLGTPAESRLGSPLSAIDPALVGLTWHLLEPWTTSRRHPGSSDRFDLSPAAARLQPSRAPPRVSIA